MSQLADVIVNLWRPNLERANIHQEFHPVFEHFVGVSDDYNDVIATIVAKESEFPGKTIVFDSEIPFQLDDTISQISAAVKAELTGLQPSDLCSGEPIIRLFVDDTVNQRFLEALASTAQLAVDRENFLNESIRNNFITKLVVYAYLYLRELAYDDQMNGKFIYFGPIKKHDHYFLTFAHHFGFDVVYLNPEEDPGFGPATRLNRLEPCGRVLERAQFGREIRQLTTTLSHFSNQVEGELFSEDSGTYRPWQFRKGTTLPLTLNGTMIDLNNLWDVPSRMRDGFRVVNGVVEVPHFFYEIEGVPSDVSEYVDLVNKLKSQPNTYVVEGNRGYPATRQDVYDLAFTLNADGRMDGEKLRNSHLYQYERYNDDTERVIIEKVVDVYNDESFLTTRNREERLAIVAYLLKLEQDIIKLVDTFDFPQNIPKLVVFCGKDQPVSQYVAALIAFMVKLGADVVILGPGCQTGLSSHINSSKVTHHRLADVDYDMTLSNLRRPTKGLLGRLFTR